MDFVCAKHARDGTTAVEDAVGHNFGSALGAWVTLVEGADASGAEDLTVAVVDALNSRRARVGVAVGADAGGELGIVAVCIRVVRQR